MARQQTVGRKRSRSKDDRQQKTRSDSGETGAGGGDAAYEQELADLLQERIKPGLNRGSIPLLARSIAKDIARRGRPDGEAEEAESDEPDDEMLDEADDEPRGAADDEPEAEADEELDDEPDEEPEAETDEELDDEPEEEADEELDDEPEAEADDELDDEPEAEADDEPEDEAEADDEYEDDEEYDDEADEADDGDEESDEAGDVAAFEDEMHRLQADLGDEWIVRFSVQGDEAWLTAEKEDGSQHVEGPTADVLREAVELLDEGGGRST